MNTHKSLLLSILTCVILAAFIAGPGCITQPQDQGNPVTPRPESTTPSLEVTPASASMKGVSWELVSYDSGRIAQESVTLGSTVTARFEQGGILQGSSGCNQYSASYETNGPHLLISTPQHTRRSCHSPPGVEHQEKAYLIDLEKVRTYTIDGDMLRLFDEAGKVVLLFRKTDSPQGLSGISWKTWHLISYRNDSGAIAGIPGSMVMTSRFLEGIVSGYSGCNCYLGQYREDGGAMAIEELIATDTNCRNETFMSVERLFIQNLQATTAYIATSDSFTLVDDRGESLLVFEATPVIS